jgi:hypothetical protein
LTYSRLALSNASSQDQGCNEDTKGRLTYIASSQCDQGCNEDTKGKLIASSLSVIRDAMKIPKESS